MINVIAKLLPVTIGAAVLPLWIIITLLLLRGKGGPVRAAAFVAGGMAVRVLQFMLFSRVFGAIVSAEGKDVFDLIPSTLLLMAGLLLFLTAVKMCVWRKDDDADAPPPRWVAILEYVSAPRAFGIAAVMMVVGLKPWVFTLSAIAIIDEGMAGRIGSVIAYLFFLLGAHSLMLTPIVISAIVPAHSKKILETALAWLERNNRMITIICSLAFGAWFFAEGMSGLAAHGEPAKARVG